MRYDVGIHSPASNTIKTGFFTLFVPLVVAVYVPYRMVGSGRVASLTVRVVGGLLFLVGAIGYFWCAVLFVQAQGTPAPISPTRRRACPRPVSHQSQPYVHFRARRWVWTVAVLPTVLHCRLWCVSICMLSSLSLFSVKSALWALNLTANTRTSVAACRAGYRGRSRKYPLWGLLESSLHAYYPCLCFASPRRAVTQRRHCVHG